MSAAGSAATKGREAEGPAPDETPRRISLPRFLGVAVLAFALLVLAWPLVGRAYDVAFREAANLACAVLGVEGVRFEDNLAHKERVAADYEHNIAVYVKSGSTGTKDHFWGTTITARHVGYVPTAIFLALLAATPVAWRRRFHALFLGGLLLYLFVAARVVTLLLYEAQNRPDADVGERWSTIVHHLHGLMNVEPTIYSIVPALIWVVVTIRRRDLARFLPAS